MWIREPAVIEEALEYKGTCSFVRLKYLADGYVSELIPYPDRLKWMPRVGYGVPNGVFKEGARAFVRVKRVWWELLNDISNADILDEGTIPYESDRDYTGQECVGFYDCYEVAFHDLWDSVYPDRPWAQNPPVCACQFEVI
jgi:hypothetical protein